MQYDTGTAQDIFPHNCGPAKTNIFNTKEMQRRGGVCEWVKAILFIVDDDKVVV